MEVQDALNMLPLGNSSSGNMTYGNLSVNVTAFEEGDVTVYRVKFNSYGKRYFQGSISRNRQKYKYADIPLQLVY